MGKKAQTKPAAKPKAAAAAAPARVEAPVSDETTLNRASFNSRMAELAAQQSGDPVEAPGAEQPAPGTNGADPLAALAAGEAEIAGGGEAAAAPGGGQKPRTLKDVAEALGISVEDAYSIELSMDPGTKGAQARTLGELKDVQERVADFDAQVLAFEESREREQNSIIRMKQELSEILAALPKGTVTKELLEQASGRAASTREAENARTLEVIPEWANNERRLEDEAGIRAHLAEYGFEDSFYSAIIDHRMKKFLRDNWRRLESVRKALAGVTEVKPSERGPSTPEQPGKPANVTPLVQPPAHGHSQSELRSIFKGLTAEQS